VNLFRQPILTEEQYQMSRLDTFTPSPRNGSRNRERDHGFDAGLTETSLSPISIS
jgi:hypothetical protein